MKTHATKSNRAFRPVTSGLTSVKSLVYGAVAVALLATSGMSAAEPVPPGMARILVKAKAGVPETVLGDELGAQNGRVVGKLQHLGVHLAHVPEAAKGHVLLALSHNPRIEYAELDTLMVPAEVIPNDTRFTDEWHLKKIGATLAWDSTSATGVTVAILDSGVDPSHPDLAGKLLAGYNAVDQAMGNTADVNGHGTAVAGTVGAVTNNNSAVASVAYGASILPVRITNQSDGYAYWSDVARGLTWAADNGAKVANISYAVSGSSTVSSAANYMKSKGGLVVASAGNGGADLGIADDPNIITVSATDSSDNLASWSSYGNVVDVSAPGVGIVTLTNGGGTGSWSGTSFSSPITAGVVALIFAAKSGLSPADAEKILKSSAVDLGATGWDNKYGYGRVSASAAVTQALGLQLTADTTAPTASISLANGATVSGTQGVTVDAKDNVAVTKVELYVGGSLLGTATTSPFQFSWDTTTLANGSVSVEARAYDAAGNSGKSLISVNVSNVSALATPDLSAPLVSIVSPANGSTLTGTVSIVLSAKDNVAVSALSCLIDGRTVATVANAGYLNFYWNTRQATKGWHTIAAVAKDAAGNTTTTSISVFAGRK